MSSPINHDGVEPSALASASTPSCASTTAKSLPRVEPVAVDTFFVGTLEGVGQGYIHTVLDLLQPLRLGLALHLECRSRASRS